MASQGRWNAGQAPSRTHSTPSTWPSPELACCCRCCTRGVPEAGGLQEDRRRPAGHPADRHPEGVVPTSRTTRARPRPTRPAERGGPTVVQPESARRRRGDNAGFPNGVGCSTSGDDGAAGDRRPDHPAGGQVLHARTSRASGIKDGTTNTNAPSSTFPYLGTPAGGYQSCREAEGLISTNDLPRS
jgi:hypothetical protein